MLMLIKKGYTHAGEFHTDDILSTVLLEKVFPGIEIERVYEVDSIPITTDTIIYDIGLGEFDHHQENRRLNQNGTPYAAFGLLWENFGKSFLEQLHFSNIEEAFDTFNENIVEKVNIGDNNGYRNVKYFYENDLIKQFNPKWYEVKESVGIYEIQFRQAVQFAHQIFDNWMRDLYETVEVNSIEQDIFDQAVEKRQNGLIILQENIPWQKFIKHSVYFDEIKLIIIKSHRGGYKLVSKNAQKLEIRNNPNLKFVHPSKFMGVAETLRDAVLAGFHLLKGYSL